MVTPAPNSFALPFFMRSALGFRSRSRIAYDAVVPLRAGAGPLVLTHPDDIRHVLVENATNYSKTRFLTGAEGRQRAGQGLLTATGDDHRRKRRLLQPLFHQAQTLQFRDVIEDRTASKLSEWKEGQRIEVAHEMGALSQSIILGVLFGLDFQDREGRLAGAIDARRKYTQYIYYSHLPYRSRLPLPVVRRNRDALAIIDDTIASEIAKRQSTLAVDDTLLSRLMNVRLPDGSAMSDQAIRDEVLTMTSAGYETLGEALTWCWYLIAKHPSEEAKFLGELSSATGHAERATQVPQDPDALPFTQSVLRESMRLYPPTWIYERVSHERDRLPSGTSIPADAKLYLCPYILHRHPRYFPDAETFAPERFASGARRPHRFAYFPFGDGAHICLGESLAMMQGVMVLAAVGRRFQLRLTSRQKIVPSGGITLTPRGGLKATVHARD